MKSTSFAIMAVICYVIVNVIIDRKLAHASPLANNLVIFGSALVFIIPLMLIQRSVDPAFVWPPVQNVWLILGLGLVVACADYFYLKAYHSGGSLIMISTMVALFPLFASIVNAMLGGDLPTSRQIFGWALAVAAILLVSEQKELPNGLKKADESKINLGQ